MITNLIKYLLGEKVIRRFAVFFLLVNFTSPLTTSATSNASVIAIAGDDVSAGLCGIKILDGTLSSGDNVTAQWQMISGPLIVNYLPASANNLFVMFQAYEGGEYQFELTVTDENGLSDKDTVKFNIMALKAEVMDDITIGGCTSVVLDATKESTLGDGYEYEWYDPNKLSDTSPSPTFTPTYSDFNKTVKFYFTVRDTFGCEAVDEFDITIKDIPVAAIDNTIIEVGCDSIRLDASWSDGYNASYKWSPQEELSFYNNNQKIVTVSNSVESVKLIMEDALGCKDSASIDLGNKRFFVDAGENIITGTCSNEFLQGESSSGLDITWEPTDLISTTWNPTVVRVRAADIRLQLGSDTSKTFPIIIKGEREDGCIKRDTAYLTATNTSFMINAGPDLNTGVCGTTINATINTDYFSSFNWSGSAFDLNENQSEINKISPFVYFGISLANSTQFLTIRGTDIFGCNRSNSVRVQVARPPIVRATPDTYTTNGCKPVQILTTTSNIDSISWSPTSGLNDPNITNPIYLGSQAKTLTVKAYDIYGCEASDIVSINSNPLIADAGQDKTTTQYAPVWLGSGVKELGYRSEWTLAENYSNTTIEYTDSTFCKFTSKEMGTYKIYLNYTDDANCNLTDSVTVEVLFGNLLPVIETISTDTPSVYLGDSITFNFTYSSEDGDSHAVKWIIESNMYGVRTLKIPVYTSGWAVAVVSDPYASTMDSIYYSIKPRNPVVINSISKSKDTVYVNESLSLSVDAKSDYSSNLDYSWQIGTEVYAVQSPVFILDEPKWAVITVSDDYTSTKDSIYLVFTAEKIVEAFEMIIEPNDTICINSETAITVVPKGEEIHRLFSQITLPNGVIVEAFDAKYNVSESGWIKVKLFNTQFEKTDSSYISVLEPQILNLGSDYICQNEYLEVNPYFSTPIEGGYTFWKNGETAQTSNSVRIDYQNFGSYTITAPNIYGCIDSAFISLDLITKPVALNDILEIETENQTGSIDLSTNDTAMAPTYSLNELPTWGTVLLSADGVLNYENSVIMHLGNDTLEYYITSNICPSLSDTGLLFVSIDNAPAIAKDNINGFSPNGDLINDYFKINNINYYPKNELFIYDKHGNLVFYKKNYTNLWDGMRNRGFGIGTKLPTGTYFYLLKAEGEKIVNGFVELRR